MDGLQIKELVGYALTPQLDICSRALQLVNQLGLEDYIQWNGLTDDRGRATPEDYQSRIVEALQRKEKGDRKTVPEEITNIMNVDTTNLKSLIGPLEEIAMQIYRTISPVMTKEMKYQYQVPFSDRPLREFSFVCEYAQHFFFGYKENEITKRGFLYIKKRWRRIQPAVIFSSYSSIPQFIHLLQKDINTAEDYTVSQVQFIKNLFDFPQIAERIVQKIRMEQEEKKQEEQRKIQERQQKISELLQELPYQNK